MNASHKNLWFARILRTLAKHYWMPQWPREKICRFFFRPGQLPSCKFSVPLNGIVYDGDFNVYQDWRIFFLGTFERETINLLSHILRSQANSVFLDVGANKGLFSVVLAQDCAAVHAFEPYRPVYDLMHRLLARNRIGNVKTHLTGLGETSEVKPYYPPGNYNIGIGSFFKEHQNDATVAPIGLKIERGDDYIDRFIDRIDAMKIDTEGFEGFVLAGMPKALERHRPAIVLEVSQTTRSTFPTAQAFTALFPQDYEFYVISDHTTYRTWRLTPVQPDNFFDHFGNVLAIPRERRGLVAHTITPAKS
jgi:FkbM family methyltransferase